MGPKPLIFKTRLCWLHVCLSWEGLRAVKAWFPLVSMSWDWSSLEHTSPGPLNCHRDAKGDCKVARMVRSHHGLALRQCWPAAAMPHTLSSVTLYSQQVSRMHELLKEPRPREGSGTKDAAYSSDLNPPRLHGASLTLPLPLAASCCSQLLCLPHCLLTLLTPIKPKVYITISVRIMWLPFPWQYPKPIYHPIQEMNLKESNKGQLQSI